MGLKFSKDRRVSFNPESHTYLLGEKPLIGVTTLISRYKNKFDAEAVAIKFAAKHGIDKDELLAKWKKAGEESREQGTAVHKVFEDYILKESVELTGQSKEKVALKFIEDIFKTYRLTPLEAEMIVYNDTIASQIDCIAQNQKGEIFILDWKTNKEISRNGYNKFMLYPFDPYPDACFYHYSLQLSIYKKLCTEYKIKDAFIVHIADNAYQIIKAEDIVGFEAILCT